MFFISIDYWMTDAILVIIFCALKRMKVKIVTRNRLHKTNVSSAVAVAHPMK